jgi:hypothetical protein
MTPELFTDRIVEIAVTGSVVRLDLGSFSTTEKDTNNQPKLEIRQRIIMPAEGFVQSFALMTRLMQDLEKRGLIRRNELPAEHAIDAPRSASGPTSPNFK